MFNAYYIDWDGHKSDEVTCATLAEAMEWIREVIDDTSLDCECEEDTLRARYGITFNVDGFEDIADRLTRPKPCAA